VCLNRDVNPTAIRPWEKDEEEEEEECFNEEEEECFKDTPHTRDVC
jgi:hypothetical protein